MWCIKLFECFDLMISFQFSLIPLVSEKSQGFVMHKDCAHLANCTDIKVVGFGKVDQWMIAFFSVELVSQKPIFKCNTAHWLEKLYTFGSFDYQILEAAINHNRDFLSIFTFEVNIFYNLYKFKQWKLIVLKNDALNNIREKESEDFVGWR